MRTRLKLFRNLAFGAGIALALMFGTGQAFARMDCSPPITTCNDKAPGYCNDVFCPTYYGPWGGMCNTNDDCCLCLEK
ncbi:MAG: hypothetical protein AMS18_11980 [Gemmatimonas sp. SG8_17]|nr:MAG: hypothetical protein AMS18_11980 [Gemmatimonas sp. SG8_17]